MMMRKFLLLTVFAVLSGCSSLEDDKPSKASSVKNINQGLLNWNSRQKITLLPHQLIPINYLENNPQIKGLLVYHYLGTGKTYLSLGFAERNPGRKVILFVPRFLKGHWLKNMKSYGVHDPSRYEIVTHKEGDKLANRDLSKAIVIVDESHRIIRKLESSDPRVADTYSKVYLNIQKSHRVLSLSGTPIFGDITDVAYQINLVAGKELIPFNKEEFRVNFMDINQHKSAAIGYYAESKMTPSLGMASGFTIGLSAAFSTGVGGAIVPIAMFAGYFMPQAVKYFFPVSDNGLRSFNVGRLSGVSGRYVSYYNFDNIDKKYYPSKSIEHEISSYNNYQIDFLIRYADSQLTTDEVMQMQKDEQTTHNRDYVSLNSTKIQDALKKRPGSGLEIGNLLHLESNGKQVVYPYKFQEALEIMLETKGPVVLYSHFYYNGLLLFKKFLDDNGQKGRYAILHPEYSIEKYENIVNDYNAGKIKFLLIHPEITEGISLVGTRQLHILETPYNKSFQEQVIGRAVRYRSHMHLPEKERHVNVHIWKPVFSRADLQHAVALRENWARNFSELNYYGERTLVDINNTIKSSTPDSTAHTNKDTLDSNMNSLEKLLQSHSIESRGAK